MVCICLYNNAQTLSTMFWTPPNVSDFYLQVLICLRCWHKYITANLIAAVDCCTFIPFVCTLQRPDEDHFQHYLLNSAAVQACRARQWSETKKVCSSCAVPQGRHCLRYSTHACHNDAAPGNAFLQPHVSQQTLPSGLWDTQEAT